MRPPRTARTALIASLAIATLAAGVFFLLREPNLSDPYLEPDYDDGIDSLQDFQNLDENGLN